MLYKFYTKSADAWVAMLETIHNAQESIYLESFILSDDELTHNFFQVLKEKAKSGVTVKIIVDQTGNFWVGHLDKKELEQSGAEIIFFNRWFYRNHRKVLVVDRKTAFIGGVNIRGQYADWLDLHMKLTGSLVKHLFHSFVRVYRLAGGKDQKILSLKKLRLAKTRSAIYKAKSWIIERWPIKGRSALRQYYQKSFHKARKSVLIVSPYFIPHSWLIDSMQKAAARGVSVEILLPEKTDVALANLANRISAFNLSDRFKFFFLPAMNHAKVLLIDGREGLIGSNNIDAQSFDFNLEASVVFQRKDMVGDLKKIINYWKSISKPFDKNQTRQKWIYPLLAFFVKLIQPIL